MINIPDEPRAYELKCQASSILYQSIAVIFEILHRSRGPHRLNEGWPHHLGYKAEHAIDLKSEFVVSAKI